MIPRAAITAWRKQAPWVGNDQVEHDLILSRAICELYQHPLLKEQLVFRGGTALHKLFFEPAGRFSEDLDFVQVTAQPIGTIISAIREQLDHWLGKPNWKQSHGRFTLNYRFETEIEPITTRKVKIEINTREHLNLHGNILKSFTVKNTWFSGEASVLTHSIEELLGTKLRALYQRKKGRDLYDIWYAIQQIRNLNTESITEIFQHYIKFTATNVSRAEFEKNLFSKQSDKIFNNDILPLLSTEQIENYKINEAHAVIQKELISKLAGESWRGV